MRRKYTHLFFDLDNTLWDFETNSYHALESTFHGYNLHEKGIDFQHFFQIYSQINIRLWEEYKAGTLSRNDLQQLRFQKTFEALNISGIHPLEMDAYYLAEMGRQTHLIEGAQEILEYAKSKNYSMYVITNGFREVQYKKLEATGLKHFFKSVFISEDVKAPKPSREIFEYAIKSANAKKSKSLMIGDDLTTDILGASQFGIDSAWFNKDGAELPPADGKNTHQINITYELISIADLKSIL